MTVKCRFCNKEYAWSTTYICEDCEDKLDKEFSKIAKDYKRPKDIKYWVSALRDKYTHQEVTASFWRLKATCQMYLTPEGKAGAIR